jgi:hypothetical protein
VNALVPSAPADVSLDVRRMLTEIDARCRKERAFEVEKLVGFGRDGNPDYPKVVLRIERSGYGGYIGAVRVQQTATNRSDFAGSLQNLDVRTACEYYMRLNSADAVDAVEKVLRAPAPKAWALITLLDTIARMNFNKEIDTK